jgi:tetratricopeptide (TPR) repeat protein
MTMEIEAIVRSNLAALMLEEERFHEAEQELLLAKELSPDLPMADRLLGQVQERLGRIPEAEESYRRAIACGDTEASYCCLSGLLRRSGRLALAGEQAFKAIENDEFTWRGWFALGTIALDEAEAYQDESYLLDAVRYFRKASDALSAAAPAINESVEPMLALHRGYAYGKLKQFGRAISEFKKCNRSSPVHSRIAIAAQANLRRLERKPPFASFPKIQLGVFGSLGILILVFALYGFLWHTPPLSAADVLALFGLALVILVIAFSLPIVTNIRVGPVSLDKESGASAPEQPEPIHPDPQVEWNIPGDPVDTRWQVIQLVFGDEPSQAASPSPPVTVSTPLPPAPRIKA